ncbi:MAG: [protein-PII] uridylyltransferase [Actinobacteria bacterium]|nr:[protein-PII] uridylyltransferase [Actinomycetota bacterium]MSW91974.1 [protein-PII] uridylyltransferase [Actinomycetota bacterium]MSY70975.1 [protein-PII] uridylyltransferase [Actinomycetota bacterium]
MPPPLRRDELVADYSLHGSAWCRRYSDLVDAWIAELWAEVAPGSSGVALIATGGYGRAELCPQSDLDLLLLTTSTSQGEALASRLWYPIWDQGLKLGHSVRTLNQALELSRDDLDTATALLAVRHLCGDPSLTEDLREGALVQWRHGAKWAIEELAENVEGRLEKLGEVAFLLEPDLKDARGGLRDVHALSWLDLAQPVLSDLDEVALRDAYEILLAARVELHRRSGRRGDVLLLQEQDAVAEALGVADADALMKNVVTAARSIAWTSDFTWHRVQASRRRRLIRERPREVAPGVVLEERTVRLAPTCNVAGDPAIALRVGLAAATQRAFIDRAALERMATEMPMMPKPWPDEARWLLTDLLMVGHPAIPVLEALDQLGLVHRMIPEWEPCRSRPQRNAYHRFTVDRHLFEAAAEAAKLVDRVDRPDLLVLGALFHDIGKGYPGDHVEVGIQMVDRIAARMGFADEEVAVLVSMVRHHLLLPDVGTRRDLDDDGTIRSVATQVGSVETLELLHALTEADSIATGPAAWGQWKAGLVAQLVRRTAHVLRGGDASEMVEAPFPTAEHRALLAERRLIVQGDAGTLTIVAPDRPGLFSRVAGTLALNGVDVVDASAHTEMGMALEVFRVKSVFGDEPNWLRVRADVERALAGRLALRARLAERARTYPAPKATNARPKAPRVVVDNHTSDLATVVEVEAPDGIGVLYRITQALLECDLDIVSAKVQTLGSDAIDAFYVRDGLGAKIEDHAYLAEIERAVLHALAGEL